MRYSVYIVMFFILCVPSSGRAQFQFAPPSHVPTLRGAFSVNAADFNEDGDIDLAVSCRRGNSVSVYLGDGRGGFPSRSDHFLGDDRWPTGVTSADLNDDGSLDLIVNNYGAPDIRIDTISILYGDGQGGFSDPVEIPSGGPNPSSVAIADYDGDGRLDLAISNRASHTPITPSVTILQQTTPGQFVLNAEHLPGNNPRYVLATNLNGDNVPDLVVANHAPSSAPSTSVFIGEGDGTFRAPIVLDAVNALQPLQVAGADLNEDGMLDLVVLNRKTARGQRGITIYTGLGGGQFRDAVYLEDWLGELPSSLIVEDIDGDGHRDIAVVNGFSDDLMIYHGNGLGGFTGPKIFLFEVGITPRAVVAADLDHDGDQDLVIANKEGDTLAILLNQKTVGIAITAATANALASGVVEISWETVEPDAGIHIYRYTGNVYTAQAGIEQSTRITASLITGSGRRRFADNDVRIGQTYTYWIEATEVDGNRHVAGPFIVKVEPPDQFSLEQNAPNPFNAGTAIKYVIARPCHTTLTVYNLLGEEIITLVDEDLLPGNYTVRWTGENNQGATVGSGVYIYTLRAGAFTETRRMSLLK